ncbi:G-type lectin S-receptor-like serine/threonine-protein kinase [Citrus sinensis]|uniref:G-type lectin S-receptor-like serine/threonine-protein kinase n=1 Tax=Citrus sinensis TaxID=2711 RepID=A0ACB8JJL8_CITSI|nr:G-type lectin S-receptor-like serine/threonine-protein kinase [Citrus sinensis]
MISVAIVVLLSSCFYSDFGTATATDTITSSQFIRDPESIISSGSKFKLGFFSPDGNFTNRYIGIWYNKGGSANKTVVWVANRNKPLIDSSGIFTISEDGNLVVLNGKKQVHWSSNVSSLANNSNTRAQLLDSGNLVLHDNISQVSIWDSFQEPTDTFYSEMKVSTDLRTGKKVQLTSWRSLSNPSIGSFSAGLDSFTIPEVFIWINGTRPYWRSGPWNGRYFIGIPDMNSVYLDGFNLGEDHQKGTRYLTFAFADNDVFFALTPQGNLEERAWVDGKAHLKIYFFYPTNDCDVYGKCGAFGSCNSQKIPICSCLLGFEPKNAEDWNRGNWSGGCVRRKPLLCERTVKTSEVEGKQDGFFKLETMKVPYFAERSSANEDKCKDQCSNNCSCKAYAYEIGVGCMIWTHNLIDIRKLPSGGTNLFIRVAHEELDQKDMKLVIILVIVGIIAIAICTFFAWRWFSKRKAMKENSKVQRLDLGEAYANFSTEKVNPARLQDLLVFNFEELANATNNFQLANKLGQGGFGPVYKGKLQDGQEIAVKRLSKASGQGQEEFMNEVMVISNLQHRNLVRLLGCCVEREENMLIYEYMPNKSLDSFLFDPQRQSLLDWPKRFNIIKGISRGLLYLHRDSRLRIIHRDLKASNILLDDDLNPKISDFGLARIFGGNQDQAATKRLVGTYGYMSPEYAMEGRFSEKSDVFSFGVLLLEIVSGRKNTSFYHEEFELTLLGYAWKLWNDNNVIDLVDPLIYESGFKMEIIRCVNVGLLCVQEFVKDRPNMSTVVSMLNSEIKDLPAAKQPAFTVRRGAYDSESSSNQNQQICSINDVTVTLMEGR